MAQKYRERLCSNCGECELTDQADAVRDPPSPAAEAHATGSPEHGPQVLFLSGGSALRSVCRELKTRTHNSIHLITPFDSGGSSADLRDAFAMLAVGDLRNRVMALADEGDAGNASVYRLFSRRLSRTASDDELRTELAALVAGEHDTMAEATPALRDMVRERLGSFVSHMPPSFPLAGASVGNLLLAGEYLANNRDIHSVMQLFSDVVVARGTVLPVVDCHLNLLAETRGGEAIRGQHAITSRGHTGDPITRLNVADPDTGAAVMPPAVDPRVRELLGLAHIICYPMGSFFTSVVANLLPAGVGAAIAAAQCPKIYIPNVGADPEQSGLTVAECVSTLARFVREDAGGNVAMEQILHTVLVDEADDVYEHGLDVAAVEALGVQVLRRKLVVRGDAVTHDPYVVCDVLLSLA